MTNLGGVPGFSGTGYVNYAGILSVVHRGGIAAKFRSEGNEDMEYNLEMSSIDPKGARIGATGIALHVDACLDLVYNCKAAAWVCSQVLSRLRQGRKRP